MPIVETKIAYRVNTFRPFFTDCGSAKLTSLFEATAPFRANSSMTNTYTISDDQLMQTHVRTYRDLSIYSAVDSILDLELDSNYVEYYKFGPVSTSSAQQLYKQEGIDQPFTVTTTYTFPTSASELRDTLVNQINSNPKGKLVDTTVTDTTIIAVHRYNDSSDFTENLYNDIQLAKDLHNAGFQRKIVYSLV